MIGIIVPSNKKYAPYIQNYIDILEKNKKDYRVMSWNKTGIKEDKIDFSFNYKVKDSDRKRIFWGYIWFIKACKKYIKKNKIDKLIILTAAPAFFLGLNYLNRYKNSFILDIRDDSPFIRKFPQKFKKICSKAYSVIVSSNEFSSWTGRKTVLCHNVDLEQLKLHIDDKILYKYTLPIRIVFAGMMIEEQCNIEVLKMFKSDNRFRHVFYGRDNFGKQMIMRYTEKEHMSNVSYEGAYNKDEIIDIYKENADLINIFRAKTTVNKNALPNKLYEAVLAGKPFIVFDHNSAISNYAKKYKIGIVIPEGIKQVNDYIFNELQSFDYKLYSNGRSSFLIQVVKDMEEYINIVKNFINSKQ